MRGKKGPQRVSWRIGKAESLNDDIEIKIVHSFPILNGIYDPNTGLNTQDAKIPDERVVMRQRDRVIDEEFDAERFALSCHAFSILDKASSLF